MKIYQAWIDGDGVAFSTVDGINILRNKGLLSNNAILSHTIEASSNDEAMKVHHEKMGWEPYKPMIG